SESRCRIGPHKNGRLLGGARLRDFRKARTRGKIHVSEEAMLRIMGAYTHRARISRLDLNVDIADRRIECARVRIRWSRIRVGSAAREEQHVCGPLLKTRRVCGEHKCGPHSPKTY